MFACLVTYFLQFAWPSLIGYYLPNKQKAKNKKIRNGSIKPFLSLHGLDFPKTSFSSFIWSHIHIHHYTKWARKPTKPKVKKFPLESQSSRRKPIGPDIFSTHKTTWHGPNFVCKNPRFIISLLTS